MNAVRIRKESQIYSAAEAAALLTFNYEARVRAYPSPFPFPMLLWINAPIWWVAYFTSCSRWILRQSERTRFYQDFEIWCSAKWDSATMFTTLTLRRIEGTSKSSLPFNWKCVYQLHSRGFLRTACTPKMFTKNISQKRFVVAILFVNSNGRNTWKSRPAHTGPI